MQTNMECIVFWQQADVAERGLGWSLDLALAVPVTCWKKAETGQFPCRQEKDIHYFLYQELMLMVSV